MMLDEALLGRKAKAADEFDRYCMDEGLDRVYLLSHSDEVCKAKPGITQLFCRLKERIRIIDMESRSEMKTSD
jgi:hypothetical protein